VGIYKDAYVVWGLHVPQTPETIYNDFEDVYKIPYGFVYTSGGDMVQGLNIGYVVHHKEAIRLCMVSWEQKDFEYGVRSIGDYRLHPNEYSTLAEFAEKYNLHEDIGWFVITSSG
jgi:hypothetical protein